MCFDRQFIREGRRALRVGPLAEAVVVVERSNGGGWGLKCELFAFLAKNVEK